MPYYEKGTVDNMLQICRKNKNALDRALRPDTNSRTGTIVKVKSALQSIQGVLKKSSTYTHMTTLIFL